MRCAYNITQPDRCRKGGTTVFDGMVVLCDEHAEMLEKLISEHMGIPEGWFK